MTTTFRAHAKINWALDITGRRADGYHLLNMVMQSIDLHDDLLIEPAEAADRAQPARVRATSNSRGSARENTFFISNSPFGKAIFQVHSPLKTHERGKMFQQKAKIFGGPQAADHV